MREAGHESTPFVSWDGILDGSGAAAGSYLHRAGKAAAGTIVALASFAPPRADFVDAYRSAFGEEPTDYAAAAYACTQVILASLEAVAEDGPGAEGLREALRAYAVDPAHRFETIIGTVGFDANGDSTQQMVSFYPRGPAGGRRGGRLGSHQAAGLRPAQLVPQAWPGMCLRRSRGRRGGDGSACTKARC